MFDTPSKPATSEYRENWDRIFMPANRESFEDVQLAKRIADMPVILDPTQAQDEMLFVSSAGTAYRIVNIAMPKDNPAEAFYRAHLPPKESNTE